jgi:hypothetical protein
MVVHSAVAHKAHVPIAVLHMCVYVGAAAVSG